MEIDVVNRNLFDESTMIELLNAYREYGNNGKISNLNGFNCLKIPVKTGHEYILSTDAAVCNNICFFDKNMKFLGGYSYNAKFIAPSNCEYVTYAISNNYTYIQFEEGQTASNHILHQSQTAIMPIQQEMLEGDYVSDVEHHEWEKIESYNNEEINTEYISTTGELSQGATVYYKLATPIDLELTEEQKAVREQKLYTYKNVTNIDVSDELASVDVTYKKDQNAVNKNFENRLAALETASTSEEA